MAIHLFSVENPLNPPKKNQSENVSFNIKKQYMQESIFFLWLTKNLKHTALSG